MMSTASSSAEVTLSEHDHVAAAPAELAAGLHFQNILPSTHFGDMPVPDHACFEFGSGISMLWTGHQRLLVVPAWKWY